MNTLLLTIILIPIIEIYLFIKIGSNIGAFNTISLIFLTAIIGIFYARYEGFNTLRSGISQLIKNENPIYEIISGAAIAFASILLIMPGFATDFFGFLLVFPFTRKLILFKFKEKYSYKRNRENKNFIDGEYKDMDDDK
ncbi:MAG: FxsA family protein [Candidatus Pelagibacter sp.]|tara:strand:+ start:671 stop:1087 length:417 start_codon:yes stop_codon:yes gene_type:complete